MKLINDFFYIISKTIEEKSATVEVSLNPDHFIFKAHFPDLPITPGMCIIQMALEIMNDIFSQKLVLEGVKNVKFLSVLQPDNNPVIFHYTKLEKLDDTTAFKAMVQVKKQNDIIAKLSFTAKINS